MRINHAVVGLGILAGTCFPLARLSAAPNAKRLIVPGKSIGQIALKTYPKGLPLGRPYAGEAGMSHYRCVWIASRRVGARIVTDTTAVVSVANAALTGKPGEVVECIRITSPYFHTPQGISTGSTLSQIRRLLHGLKEAPGISSLQEVPNTGIAFEFADTISQPTSKCIAISVYRADKPVYLDAKQVGDLIKLRS